MNDWTCRDCQNYVTEDKYNPGFCDLTGWCIRDMNFCPLDEIYTKEYEEVNNE